VNGLSPEDIVSNLHLHVRNEEWRSCQLKASHPSPCYELATFARLRDHVAEAGAKATLEKRILPRNELTGEVETPRLLLRKKDQSFFRQYVLESKPLPAKQNLDAPQQRIFENLGSIDAFCNGKSEKVLKLFANYMLTKVYVVFVKTDSQKSAYRLFNVLNARGMSLSNSDLIKNRFFSMLGTQGEDRSDELEAHWMELEEELGIDRLDAFLGHHRTAVTATKSRGTLHEEFNSLIQATGAGPFTFLDEVIHSAQNYQRIVESDFTTLSRYVHCAPCIGWNTTSGFLRCWHF
jgi:Protein of unknown function DUF262